MAQQQDKQMQQDRQNQGNDNQRQQAYEGFAAEQDEQLENQQQSNRQSVDYYDDGEMLPEGMGEQWRAQEDTNELE